MNKTLTTKSGFTFVEVLVTMGLMLLFLPFAASMLTNSQLLASYAKHKLQAAYVAQQILETQRQNPFITLTAGQTSTIGPSSVVLDTKGNYNNTTCGNSNAFCGTAVVTVTPTVYTNAAGVKTTSSTVNHFVVQIYWNEKISVLFVPITETFAEDMANDPILN